MKQAGRRPQAPKAEAGTPAAAGASPAARPQPAAGLARPPPPKGPPPGSRPAARPPSPSSDGGQDDDRKSPESPPPPGGAAGATAAKALSPAAPGAGVDDDDDTDVEEIDMGGSAEEDAPASPAEERAGAAAASAASGAGGPRGDISDDEDAAPPPPPPPASDPGDEAAAGDGAAALPGEEGLGVGVERFQLVRPGRMTITLHRGEEVYKPDRRGQSTKIDPYVKLEVGRGGKRPLRAKSSVRKNSGATPSWGGEDVLLDMGDPMALVQDDALTLHYEVWDSNIFSDVKLGEGTVSLLRFFGYELEPGEDPRMHWLPLTVTPPGRLGGQAQRPEPAGRVLVGVRFQPTRPGLLVVTTFEGIGLRSMDMFTDQDPYVVLELGEQRARGSTVSRGGTDPYLNEEELEVMVTRENWTKPLRVAMFDEDPGRDDFIGECLLTVLDLTSLAPGDAGAIENVFELTAGGKPAGQVRLGFRFFPAGELTVEVVEGRRLANRETVGNMDPYLKLTVGGSRHPVTRKTKVDARAGAEPVWNEVFRFDVVMEHEARIEVWDADTFTADDLVGATTMSLLPVFKAGYRDHWFQLASRSSWGKVESAGEVFLKLDFKAARGVRFPQRQPDMDSFDHAQRITRDGRLVGDLEAAKEEEEAEEAAAEFTDAEVEDAFTFLDLDSNLHLSAAELRHVLICMGELVTDEEIDEMVRMVDGDGDGQISFDEFRRLALHPDPASAEFDVLVRGGLGGSAEAATRAIEDRTRASASAATRAPPPPPSGPGAGPAVSRTASVAREKHARAERRRFLELFAADQRIRAPDLQATWDRFLADRPMPTGGADAAAASGWSDLASFQEMVDAFAAEPTGEARQLYNVFVDPDSGRLPLRRLILALSGFAGADRTQRVSLCFYLFDDDRSNSIDEGELREILRANHLATDLKQVENKAKHVLAQADKDGDGTIDMEEFVVLAARMPNLLFPNFAPEDAAT